MNTFELWKKRDKHAQSTRLRIEEPAEPFLHVAVDHFALSLLVRIHYTDNRYPVRPRLVHLVSTPRTVQGLRCERNKSINQLSRSHLTGTDLVIEEQKDRARLDDSQGQLFLRDLLYKSRENENKQQDQS